ncbi:glycosyl hydrolase family 8 [Pseudoroseomonas globiformis]|uniref:cellulase n=1 Tax=Teichococcus globiformis TaxID=2307229 RepID=A0ABV7G5D8_9PROT
MPPHSSRRVLLAALASAPAFLAGPWAHAVPRPGAEPSPGMLEDWRTFRRSFLRPDGRVVDTGNQGVSHSEGQGWAMFAAERCGDRNAFDLIWSWTSLVLARPSDRLLAWRYVPGSGNPVPDSNNASDGDLFAAAALLLAAERWRHPPYAEAGVAIAADVLRLLLRRVAGKVVLLPGARGFEETASVTLNPSYYAFPALPVLARAVPDPVWGELADDGVELLRQARFGAWGLPPDWLSLRRQDGSLSLAEGWPARFSYDAVRVPLYLAWAGLDGEPVVRAASGFWQRARPVPAWTDLRTNQLAPYPASEGVQKLAGWISGRGVVSSGGTDDYYSSVLKLLTSCAAFSLK